jgi:hypothetical protein
MRRVILFTLSLLTVLAISLAQTFVSAPRLLAQVYTADLTTTGFAISSGPHGPYVAANAFDDNGETFFQGPEIGAAVNGAAWIGQDFGSGNAKHVRRITLKQHSAACCQVSSVKVQYSSDGSTWSDQSTITVALSDAVQTFDLASSGSYQYWRVIANSGTSLWQWNVLEIEMMEIRPSTATPTNTPNYYAVMTLPSSGQAAAIVYQVSAGEGAIISLLAMIAVLLVVGLYLMIRQGMS